MQGYVLGNTDGEHMFNASGEVVIKVDPSRGSNDLSLGTQLVPPGAGIPRHRHLYWDEFIYVLDGGGTVIVEDVRAFCGTCKCTPRQFMDIGGTDPATLSRST